MRGTMRLWLAVMLTLLARSRPAAAAEIVRLDADTWQLAPAGKERDAIYGDYVIRNDRVVAVIGGAAPNRNAHYNCRNVQGAVIDFTLRGAENDQLTAFKPHGESTGAPLATRIEVLQASGPEVRLRAVLPASAAHPVEAVTEYRLRDGDAHLVIVTRYRNPGEQAVNRRLSDKMRCDQTFTQTPAGEFPIVVFYDRWFGAAYAVARPGGRCYTNGTWGGMGGINSGTWIDYPDLIANPSTRDSVLAPGQEVTLTRYLIAARHPGEAQLVARRLLGMPTAQVTFQLRTAGGQPAAGADLELRQGDRLVTEAQADAAGIATAGLAEGRYTLVVTQVGRPRHEQPVDVRGDATVAVTVGPLSQIEFHVTDERGGSSPCKVQFVGVDGTPDPNFGPEQRARCGNLVHSHTGEFSVAVPPGNYYLILSRGPEYDAVYRYVSVGEGQTVRVGARLVRSVDTRGWVSGDFHNHSTESGDNTTETESRILCLIAEGVEFAPSTEHNRIQSYRPRLRALGVEHLLATSDGIELTGSPLPLNHHNAFPLRLIPGAQNGGAPDPDPDPRAQIRRLFQHDNNAEKLVQQNHPDIGWLFFDRDGDGRHDMGFGTFEFTHVIEVWQTTILSMRPTSGTGAQERNNRIFNWLQLLNQGFRLPGVANTDAHYCFHQSGVIRNYIRSSTDDPARIDEVEMVRNAKAGRLVMTNGPFLEVTLNGRGPGEELTLRGGSRGRLRVRVQCANWLDVDRIQVLVNGRPDPNLNFTRQSHPQYFQDGVVKFDREIPIRLERDAHLIVVAVGEHATTGPVMGHRGDPPIAISNPIYVDVDGGGFQPNRDTLGAPLPTRKS